MLDFAYSHITSFKKSLKGTKVFNLFYFKVTGGLMEVQTFYQTLRLGWKHHKFAITVDIVWVMEMLTATSEKGLVWLGSAYTVDG